MAWRLRASVVCGIIDNRVKGRIEGCLWLCGREDPVELRLEGNGYWDVAGCLFVFENPDPRPAEDEHTDLFPEQVGAIGDYTASRKVRAFDVPIEEALEMIRRGEKPAGHMANSLYLEWFSERNGRVVIEGCDYITKIVDTAWLLNEEEELEQREKSAESVAGFMGQLVGAFESTDAQPEDEAPSHDPKDDKPMDEFEWERFLKESDRSTDKYFRLLEKYMIHPDCDRIVAREMGWDEPFQGYEEVVWTDEAPVPNPLTEGVDWITGSHGHPVHPLQEQASQTVKGLRQECRNAGLLDETAGNNLHDMLSSGQRFGAKLAAALNSLAYDEIRDNGFVVASLKRALPYFDEMMEAMDKIRKQKLIAEERLQRFCDDMFAIRAGIVELMERFRNEI